jgi:aerobic carbon-monoxide dehydrogenase small subunit
MSIEIQLQVNGVAQCAQVPPHTLLLDYVRDHLHLRGTHQACDTAQCGACTVLVDGKAIKSCNVLVAQASGQVVCTIEGLSPVDGPLHVMQQAFSQHHALQCGFCTPGFVMRAVALAAELGDASAPPSAQQVRQALGGNLCRCTGYEGIVKAVCAGLSAMRAKALV